MQYIVAAASNPLKKIPTGAFFLERQIGSLLIMVMLMLLFLACFGYSAYPASVCAITPLFGGVTSTQAHYLVWGVFARPLLSHYPIREPQK